MAELLSPGLRALSEAKNQISNEHHCPEEQGCLRQVTSPLKSPLLFGDTEAPFRKEAPGILEGVVLCWGQVGRWPQEPGCAALQKPCPVPGLLPLTLQCCFLLLKWVRVLSIFSVKSQVKNFIEQADTLHPPFYSISAPDACQSLDSRAQRVKQKLYCASEMTYVIIINGWGLMMASCVLGTMLNMWTVLFHLIVTIIHQGRCIFIFILWMEKLKNLDFFFLSLELMQYCPAHHCSSFKCLGGQRTFHRNLRIRLSAEPHVPRKIFIFLNPDAQSPPGSFQLFKIVAEIRIKCEKVLSGSEGC